MSFSTGFFSNQSTGDSSKKEVVIAPSPKYKPELSSLLATIPSHYGKLAAGASGKNLETNRQQLLSGYSETDWPTLLDYCLSVFEKKKATLRGKPTEAEFRQEMERCRRYHTEAQRDAE